MSIDLTWCCFSQGEVRLTVLIDKNAYKPGETIQISLEIDNSESKLDITSVFVTLSRRFRLRSNIGDSSITSETINSCSSNHSLRWRNLLSEVTETASGFDFPRNREDADSEMYNIECVYLSVGAETNGAFMCCRGQPEVVTEVVIYSREQRETRRVDKKTSKKRKRNPQSLR